MRNRTATRAFPVWSNYPKPLENKAETPPEGATVKLRLLELPGVGLTVLLTILGDRGEV